MTAAGRISHRHQKRLARLRKWLPCCREWLRFESIEIRACDTVDWEFWYAGRRLGCYSTGSARYVSDQRDFARRCTNLTRACYMAISDKVWLLKEGGHERRGGVMDG